MGFESMKGPVGKAFREGYAVPAFCAWNAEVMEVILAAAARLRAPVILMQGPGEFPLLPPAAMAAVAYAIKERHDIPAVLHLDHGDSPAMVRECIACRYTSVMLDFSALPFDQNAGALK